MEMALRCISDKNSCFFWKPLQGAVTISSSAALLGTLPKGQGLKQIKTGVSLLFTSKIT